MNTHEERMSHFDVKNNSGEEVPPFAVMQVDGATKQNGEVVLEIVKPDGSGNSFLLNGSMSIGIGSNGWGSADWGKRAALDSGETAPSEGDEWGAKSGQWTLSPEGTGFTVLGDVANDTARVRLTGGGGSSGLGAAVYAVVFTQAGKASYSGSKYDFMVCPGSIGKCLRLERITEAGTPATTWQASTAYSAEELWSATVSGGLTNPVDNNGVPLLAGRLYNFWYPTGQTSGSSLDEAEYAKAEVQEWVPDGAHVGCFGVRHFSSDYRLDLECIYDEVPLDEGRLIRISSASGDKIPAGPYNPSDPPHVVGEYVRLPTDFWRAHDDYVLGQDQIPYHAADEDEFSLGGGECE